MCPIASGNWNNESNAGVWYVNCNNSRTTTNTNNGFRAADSTPPHGPIQGRSGVKGDAFRLGAQAPAKSAGSRLSSRCRVALDRQAGGFR